MRRAWFGLMVAAACATSLGQSWSAAYEKGLQELRSKQWATARDAFKQAVAMRTDDSSNPTTLPGSITDRKVWRNGAPYSPNFLAAYAGYRSASEQSGDSRTGLLNEVATELEGLLAKNQLSAESFYFLSRTYTDLSATEKRMALDEKYSASKDKLTWRIDREGMLPEDVAQFTQASPNNPQNPPTQGGSTTQPPILPPPPISTGPTTAPSVAGRVAVVPNKFALIIGNSQSKIADLSVPHANEDAQLMRETLITNAGYDEKNIELVLNATKDQILASAKALSDRIEPGTKATILIYFVGVGANLDGKDYLAGVDSELISDANSMAPKMEIYRSFIAKEANIIALFQAPRPVNRGRYFGGETPMFGKIAQMQSTMPDGQVLSTIRGGKTVGIFADAIANVMADLRSNQTPLMEFGWQVFYKMRGGPGGGGSIQTPTLPVTVQLADTTPF